MKPQRSSSYTDKRYVHFLQGPLPYYGKLIKFGRALTPLWGTVEEVMHRGASECMERYNILMKCSPAAEEELLHNSAKDWKYDLDSQNELYHQARAEIANGQRKMDKRVAREKQLEMLHRLVSMKRIPFKIPPSGFYDVIEEKRSSIAGRGYAHFFQELYFDSLKCKARSFHYLIIWATIIYMY